MYFNIASPHGIANFQFRIKKVGTRINIENAGFYDFYFLPGGSVEGVPIE